MKAEQVPISGTETFNGLVNDFTTALVEMGQLLKM
jgi:hypothetical protein